MGGCPCCDVGRMESVGRKDWDLGMQLQFGSVVYDVVHSDERLYFNRQEVLSICEHDQCQLILSTRVTPRLQVKVVAEARQRIERHLAATATPMFDD